MSDDRIREMMDSLFLSGALEVSAVDENGEILYSFTNKLKEIDPYLEQLSEYTPITLGTIPVTYYDTETEAVEHRSKVDNLLNLITKMEVDSVAQSDSVCSSPAYDPNECLSNEESLWMSVEKVLRAVELN